MNVSCSSSISIVVTGVSCAADDLVDDGADAVGDRDRVLAVAGDVERARGVDAADGDDRELLGDQRVLRVGDVDHVDARVGGRQHAELRRLTADDGDLLDGDVDALAVRGQIDESSTVDVGKGALALVAAVPRQELRVRAKSLTSKSRKPDSG